MSRFYLFISKIEPMIQTNIYEFPNVSVTAYLAIYLPLTIMAIEASNIIEKCLLIVINHNRCRMQAKIFFHVQDLPLTGDGFQRGDALVHETQFFQKVSNLGYIQVRTSKGISQTYLINFRKRLYYFDRYHYFISSPKQRK